MGRLACWWPAPAWSGDRLLTDESGSWSRDGWADDWDPGLGLGKTAPGLGVRLGARSAATPRLPTLHLDAGYWAMPVLGPVAATMFRSNRSIRPGDHLPRRSEPAGRRPPERSSGASRATRQTLRLE